MPDSESTASGESIVAPRTPRKPSYWANMVSQYEKRNASLEQRQTELAERIRLMECAVPSLLMGAMVSMKRNSDPGSKLLIQAGGMSRGNEESSSSSSPSSSFNKNKETATNRRKIIEPVIHRRANVRAETNRFFKNTDFRP